MSFLDKLVDFDNQPLSQIQFNMIKWFGFDRVDIPVCQRPNVESGAWITIQIVKGECTWHADGQRIDIAKRRLIDFLKEQKVI